MWALGSSGSETLRVGTNGVGQLVPSKSKQSVVRNSPVP